jgi:hypothetical protein
MPQPSRRFPCGEFFPGEAPRPGDGASTNVPPTYFPDPPRYDPPIIPPGDIFPPGGGDIPNPGGGSTGGGGTGGGTGGGPGGPGEGEADGPTTPGGEGPPVWGPMGGGGGGPATPGGGVGYRCVTGTLPCPNAPTKTLKRTRTKVACSLTDARRDSPRAGMMFINRDGGYDSRADGLCLDFPASFFAGCIDDPAVPQNCIQGPFTGRRNPGLASGGSTQQEPQGDPRVTIPPRLNSTTLSNQERVANGSIVQSNVKSQQIILSIPIKEEQTFSLDSPSLLMRASASSSYNETYGLFDEKFNFFRTVPSNETKLVGNSYYLKVFKDQVAEEVNYFLVRTFNTSPWSEKYFDSLTENKIILSLRDELLTAISNIHTIGGTRVNRSQIIEAIKSHLVAGTIDEFDPNYYYYVYNSQLNDSIINVPSDGETYKNIKATMGLFELSSVTPDFTQYDNLRERDDYKRSRFLLEDIEANISAETLDGSEYRIYLNNAGVSAQLVNPIAPPQFLNIGDGGGYYISSIKGSSELPLVVSTELSSARYISPSLRHNVLQILGTDIGIILTASSVLNEHEFSISYDPSADISPMYFKLNFETITDITNPNSVVNVLSASYSRISDEEAETHSRNYSFNLIKVNLDFRDPIIHYMRDTSTVTLEQDDFNLRSFDNNRSVISNRIMLRNIPAAIIVTPGMGTAHNPFNSKSKLQSYEGSSVTRNITLSPSFEVHSNLITKPPLEVSNVFNTLNTPYFGLYEKLYDQDIHSNIYTYSPESNIFSKSYFVNGEYTSQQPDNTYRENSAEATLVSLVDKLASLPGVSSLTWWDVYRRLTSTEIGKLSYIDPVDLIKKLSSGWRSGIPIKNVLTRREVNPTGIPDGTVVPDDLIIINEIDRELN